VGISRDCPKFLTPHIISGTGKAMNFKLRTHIHRIDRHKSPLKISGKVAVGVLRDSKFSRPPIHRLHRAVIFAVSQLSCSSSSSPTTQRISNSLYSWKLSIAEGLAIKLAT